MAIFGQEYPKIVVSASGEEILLEHTKWDYSFFNADVIEHVSIFTGERIYRYARNQSIFQLDVNLCNYSASEASNRFQKLYQNKNNALIFYPHSDYLTASVDVYNTPVNYYITEFTPYYKDSDNKYDAVLITLSPEKNSVMKAIDNYLGYGYNYGIVYDFSGW